jgi:UDP-glucose 4-epimerase
MAARGVICATHLLMQHDLAGASIAVTGGCGFIGSHLVAGLVRRGAGRIVVIDSLRYGDRANLGALSERVEIVQHTLGFDPPERLAAALAGVAFLFHLAAEKHNQSKDDPVRVYRSNVEGTHSLYEQASAAGVKKIVFSSSLYAYGRTSGGPFVETELPEPHTVYGITKLTGEHILRYFAKQGGTQTVALRYLFVYGPKQFAGMGYKSVIVKNFGRLLGGEPPTIYGDGKQALDYVYVEDVVDATLRAMERSVDGEVINIGSGEPTSVEALVDTMIEVSGRSVAKLYGPPDWTAGSCRFAAVDKAARLLDWRATTPLTEGLARTYAWLAHDEHR